MIDHSCQPFEEFCVIPVGGLGNRILAILSGLRLVQKGYYKSMRICWEAAEEVAAEISDIFDTTNLNLGLPFADGPILPLHNRPKGTPVPNYNRINIISFDRFTSINDKDHSTFHDDLKDNCCHLKFRSDLVALANTIDPNKCVGVHCRRTDFWVTNHEQAARKYIALDRNLAKYLTIKFPDKTFFIATDSPYTMVFFEEFFRGREIHFPKGNYPIWRSRNLKSIQEAVVDMILLSRCETIVADSTSTFSLVAAWLGGKNKHRADLEKME